MAVAAVSFTACTSPDKSGEQKHTTKTESAMNNVVSIIEIPVTDLPRAIKFYNTILKITIQEAEMGDVKMGVLPAEEGSVNVVLTKGADYKPVADGCILYLNGGDNLQTVLDKIEPNGGQVIVPKTEISPEMGFFALFIDTEGNKLGLHSSN